jgi:hypothetical protein
MLTVLTMLTMIYGFENTSSDREQGSTIQPSLAAAGGWHPWSAPPTPKKTARLPSAKPALTAASRALARLPERHRRLPRSEAGAQARLSAAEIGGIDQEDRNWQRERNTKARRLDELSGEIEWRRGVRRNPAGPGERVRIEAN